MALKGLNFKVMAAGDSYNDTGMLGAADAGFFIHPPESIVAAVSAVSGDALVCRAEGRVRCCCGTALSRAH